MGNKLVDHLPGIQLPLLQNIKIQSFVEPPLSNFPDKKNTCKDNSIPTPTESNILVGIEGQR
jgi:hypothetical protein